jgi:O-antigen ligase
MGLALYLTYSRTALVGLAVAVAVLGVLRYRRLLLILVIAGLLLLLLPQAQYYVERLIDGLQFQDRANQMRLGEYKDTFTLIARHPLLGVGFTGTPEIDIYVSVASIYFLMAAQMGLIGLAVFLFTIATLFVWLWSRRGAVVGKPMQESILLGAVMGLVGALTGGLADHYYFNMDFPSTVTLFWLFAGLAVSSMLVATQPEGPAGVPSAEAGSRAAT